MSTSVVAALVAKGCSLERDRGGPDPRHQALLRPNSQNKERLGSPIQRKPWCRATQGRPVRSAIPVSEGDIAAEANPRLGGSSRGPGTVMRHLRCSRIPSAASLPRCPGLGYALDHFFWASAATLDLRAQQVNNQTKSPGSVSFRCDRNRVLF